MYELVNWWMEAEKIDETIRGLNKMAGFIDGLITRAMIGR